jgi:hypothetical protein
MRPARFLLLILAPLAYIEDGKPAGLFYDIVAEARFAKFDRDTGRPYTWPNSNWSLRCRRLIL